MGEEIVLCEVLKKRGNALGASVNFPKTKIIIFCSRFVFLNVFIFNFYFLLK